jgi:hypothetical protein
VPGEPLLRDRDRGFLPLRISMPRPGAARSSASVAMSLGRGIARAATDLVGAGNGASASKSGSITADERELGCRCRRRGAVSFGAARLLLVPEDSEVHRVVHDAPFDRSRLPS